MTETLGELFAATPLVTTLTDVYTVGAGTSVVVSGIDVCNRSGATTFRFSVAPSGAADANSQYRYYDAPLNANETITIGQGWTLAAGTVLRAYVGAATVSIGGYGSVITTT